MQIHKREGYALLCREAQRHACHGDMEATLGNPSPLPSLGLFFFFEISKRVLKIGGVSVTYSCDVLLWRQSWCKWKVTYKFPESEQYDPLDQDCAIQTEWSFAEKGGRNKNQKMFHHHGRLMFLAGLKDVSGSQRSVTFVTAAVVVQTLSDASAITVG